MKKVMFVALGLLLVGCGSKLNIVMKENITLEYGEEADQSLLYDKDKSEEKLTVKEIKDYDNKKLGEQEIRVIFALEDKVQEEKVKVNVKDTKAPEIKLKKDKVEITQGDQFDPASNIKSVKDPIDGDIKKSDDQKLKKNGYLITGDVDTKKVKDGYKVKVTAYDKNGNKAEKEYTVNVKAKPEEPKQEAVSTAQAAYTAPVQSNGSTGYTAPAQSGGGSAAGNGGGSSQPAMLCPTGQEPDKPCDAMISHPSILEASTGVLYNTWDEANAVGMDLLKNDRNVSNYAVYSIHYNNGNEKWVLCINEQ